MGAQTTPPGPRIGSGDRQAVNNNNKKCRRVGGANGGVGWRGRLRSGAGKATQGEQPRRDAAASPDRLRAAGLRDDDILGKAKPWRRWRSRWRQGLGRGREEREGRGGPRGRDAPARDAITAARARPRLPKPAGRSAPRATPAARCGLGVTRTSRCGLLGVTPVPPAAGCARRVRGAGSHRRTLDFPLNFAVNVKPL